MELNRAYVSLLRAGELEAAISRGFCCQPVNAGYMKTELDAFPESPEDGTWISRQTNPTPERPQTGTEEPERPVLGKAVSLERAKKKPRLVAPPCPDCAGMGQCLCDGCAKPRRDGWIDRSPCKRCKGTGALLQ